MASVIPAIADASMATIKTATLGKEFLISRDALWDYYSTNSGIFAKNPTIAGGGGGGGGGDDDPTELAKRVTAVEDNMAKTAKAAEDAQSIINAQSPDGFIVSNDVTEIDDILHNQHVLKDAQNTFLSTVVGND